MRFSKSANLCFCAVVFGATLVASGCGWRLRGALTMPDAMAVTHVTSSDRTSELLRHVKRELGAAGVKIVEAPEENAAVLSIRPSRGKRVLSVGPDGKAREYEVYYTVHFSVQKPGSDFRIEPQQITLTRDFVYDPLEALAVSQEQELLEQSMERDLARMVMERLSSAGKRGQPRRTSGAGTPEPGTLDAGGPKNGAQGSPETTPAQ